MDHYFSEEAEMLVKKAERVSIDHLEALDVITAEIRQATDHDDILVLLFRSDFLAWEYEQIMASIKEELDRLRRRHIEEG
jgi:hypothetical protein